MQTSILLNPCDTSDIDLSDYLLVADNGGGIQLIWTGGKPEDKYSHHYDSPEQLAEDIVYALTEGDEPDTWDGNELTGDVEEDSQYLRWEVYDYDAERNGGIRWYDLDGRIPAGESAWGGAMTILCDKLVGLLAAAGRLDLVSVHNS